MDYHIAPTEAAFMISKNITMWSKEAVFQKCSIIVLILLCLGYGIPLKAQGPPPPPNLSLQWIDQGGFGLQWDMDPFADDYFLDIALDPFFTNFIYQDFNLGYTDNYSPNGMPEGEILYCRVRANSYTYGQSPNSNTVTVPMPPLLTGPSDITSNSFTANWVEIMGIDGYQVDVSRYSNFSSFEQIDLFTPTNSISIPVSEAGIRYYYRVQSVIGGTASGESSYMMVEIPPDPPIANPPTSITANSFTASWNPVTNADYYLLDVAEDIDFISSYPVDEVEYGTEHLIFPASGTKTFYYRVQTQASIGRSEESNIIQVLLLPDLPAVMPPGDITPFSFTANWGPALGADIYLLDVARDPGFSDLVLTDMPVTATSFNVVGLDPAMDYYYRVQAQNASGTTDESGFETASLPLPPPPPAPNVLDASLVAQNSFTANWESVPDAIEYRLDVYRQPGNVYIISDIPVLGTSYPVGGLTPGYDYFYEVRTVDQYQASASSAPMSVSIPLLTPNVFPVPPGDVTEDGFTANWTLVEGATEYEVQVSEIVDFSIITQSAIVPGATTTNIIGLAPGIDYHYRVQARNAGGSSDYSTSEPVYLKPITPVLSPPGPVSTNTVTLTWNPVPGDNISYDLQIATDAAFGNIFQTHSGIGTESKFISGLEWGQTYHFRVFAVHGMGPISDPSTSLNFQVFPEVPTAVSPTEITTQQFRAKWQIAQGADEYLLDVSESSTLSPKLPGYNSQVISGIDTLVNGLNPGKIYYYQVRARNDAGTTQNSNPVQTITLPNPPVALDAVNHTAGSFLARWTEPGGTDDYLLDVSTSSTFGTFVSPYQNFPVAGTEWTVDIGLLPGTDYFFRIRARNASGNSEYSNSIPTKTRTSAPNGVVFGDVTGNTIPVSWTNVSGADSYEIDLATDIAFGQNYQVFPSVVPNYTIGGLSNGTEYFVRIRALNSSGPSDYSATISTITVPGPPSLLPPAMIQSDRFDASWSSTQGATGYQLDVASDQLFTQIVPGYLDDPVTGNLKTVIGLASGTEYFFRVQAGNSNGYSDESHPPMSVLTVPAPPSTFTVSGITTSQFQLSWDEATGAESYYLDVDDDSDFSSPIPQYHNHLVLTNQEIVENLQPGTEYHFRVRSYNISGTSNNSIPDAAVTLLEAPVLEVASSVKSNQFVANWLPVVGAQGYRLDVATDASFLTKVPGFDEIYVVGTSYLVDQLTQLTTYYYRVRAETSWIESDYVTDELTTLKFVVWNYADEIIHTEVDDKVGIGTSAPDELLTVDGKVHAEEIIIDLNMPAPDYVFASDYKLMSMEELREFITENKHLPGIPSASEFAEKGIHSQQLSMSLLKKIEELTLYIIQQTDVLNDLTTSNATLKQEILELQKK